MRPLASITIITISKQMPSRVSKYVCKQTIYSPEVKKNQGAFKGLARAAVLKAALKRCALRCRFITLKISESRVRSSEFQTASAVCL